MELPSALSKALIKRGSIFHSKDDRFREIGHGKYFVVIGVSQTRVVGFFFINSNINPKEWKNSARFALQYPIRARDYPSFLRHDSFIGCASLQEWAYDDLLDSIMRGQTEYKATLHESHLRDILEQARQSEVFSEEEIESYFGE
ncbi:hypothetical protein BHU09_06465 [Tannerella sp. oral taxon 808]|nr:hypothetical protein BHU09_06465 [Tannerella sp. oral taxon 808]DAL01936.1 MAG TPA: hypothetical protein [Caudoviricetes sp.]